MARKRGRPAKQPLVIVGSSVSASVIAETIERGSSQQVVTPIGDPFSARSIDLGVKSTNPDVHKKLILSPHATPNTTLNQPIMTSNPAAQEISTGEIRE